MLKVFQESEIIDMFLDTITRNNYTMNFTHHIRSNIDIITLGNFLNIIVYLDKKKGYLLWNWITSYNDNHACFQS